MIKLPLSLRPLLTEKQTGQFFHIGNWRLRHLARRLTIDRFGFSSTFWPIWFENCVSIDELLIFIEFDLAAWLNSFNRV